MTLTHSATMAAPRPNVSSPIGRGARIIKPEAYLAEPLTADVERLADPAVAITDADVVNILVKYFYAYVYPGAEAHAVPLADISELFENFYMIWRAEDEERGQARREFSQFGFALRMLGDIPKSAHIFRSIAARPLIIPDPEAGYRGLDLGSGTGALGLAAMLQARRNGFREPILTGVERDPVTAARTRDLHGRLGLGEILEDDARNRRLYDKLGQEPIRFVANETIPPSFQRLRSEHFTSIHATLFEKCARRLKGALFFPEALVVYEPRSSLSVVLSANNRFQTPRHYRHLHLYPQAIVIEGRLRRLHRLGRDFAKFVPKAFLEIMPGRW